MGNRKKEFLTELSKKFLNKYNLKLTAKLQFQSFQKAH